MSRDRTLFIGPRLRRLRRDLGLTQATMADEMGISSSYIALIERNQRPVTADVLMRLARTYGVDVASFAGDDGQGTVERLGDLLRDPLFADLDIGAQEPGDLALNHPGLAEALMRVHTAYREGQLALADRGDGPSGDAPLEDVRAFLAARRNFFPVLDDQAERLARKCADTGGMEAELKEGHGFNLRRLPPDVMHHAVRRVDLHRRELVIADTLDGASYRFQLALQLVYLSLSDTIAAAVREGTLPTDNAKRLARRALGNYAAAAMLMPYGAFFREAERRRYDVIALSRVFGCSFEQTAHRLTTLQKPGASGVPFFFIRVDAAGNVSKRLDGGEAAFARHGGSCPKWSLHTAFRHPGELMTEVLELPDGERFFSIVRTVTAGGGSHGERRIDRAVALGCPIEHAPRLVYALDKDALSQPTEIGVSCRLCHRARCSARAEPPIGRQLLLDDDRRFVAPFGFSDG